MDVLKRNRRRWSTSLEGFYKELDGLGSLNPSSERLRDGTTVRREKPREDPWIQ